MRFSFALPLGIACRLHGKGQGAVRKLIKIQTNSLEILKNFMNEAMRMLHDSIDPAIYCASAALGYVCVNGSARNGPADN
jgi:hypothetical protein